MKESYFWSTIRKGLPEVHWTRIENTAVAGASDVNAAWHGKEAWVELKMMRGRQLEFRKSQLGWTARRLGTDARNVAVVARKDKLVMAWPGSIMFVKPARVTEKTVCIVPPTPALILTPPMQWVLLRDFLFEGGLQLAFNLI